MIRKTVLITGASSGIGLNLAKKFARGGFDLVITARSTDKLNELAAELSRKFEIDVKVITKDLSKGTAALEIYEELDCKGIQVDILVNNAGFGMHGDFLDIDIAEEMDMIQTNITSLMALTKLFLGSMIERGEGKILNIASTAALVPTPYMATYSGTKGFVRNFSEALAEEVRNTGVRVTTICPGPAKTGFSNRAHSGDAFAFKYLAMTAEKVADIAYTSALKGKSFVVPGLFNKLQMFLSKISPRWVALFIARLEMGK